MTLEQLQLERLRNLPLISILGLGPPPLLVCQRSLPGWLRPVCGFKYHLLADDSQVSFLGSEMSPEFHTCVFSFLPHVFSWMCKRDINRTCQDETFYFHLPPIPSSPELPTSVNGTTNHSSAQAKNLVVILDSHVSFTP